jgi:hypothetical protein
MPQMWLRPFMGGTMVYGLPRRQGPDFGAEIGRYPQHRQQALVSAYSIGLTNP